MQSIDIFSLNTLAFFSKVHLSWFELNWQLSTMQLLAQQLSTPWGGVKAEVKPRGLR